MSKIVYFYSVEFVLFLLLVLVFYWFLPQKFKNTFLLIASYLFYASWSLKLLWPLLASTAIDYLAAQKIANFEDKKTKKMFLSLSLAANLGLLFYFKYFNFFIENLNSLFTSLGLTSDISTLSIILPLGISFYTFQTMSYTIDVYRGQQKPIKNIIDFALFVSFFPQLIAGPIEKSTNLIPEILKTKFFKKIPYSKALYLFAFGMFKKVVVSDYIATLADASLNSSSVDLASLFLGGFLFMVQVYCDFSGYSNMARGISYFFGIELSTNFNLPFFSKNPSDFWNRWHITLSDWVRQYLFVPLLLKTRSSYLAAAVCLPLMGFWHGSSWTYILWGVYWLILVLLYQTFQSLFYKQKKHSVYIDNKSIKALLAVPIMLVFSSLSFVLFYCKNTKDLMQIFNHVITSRVDWSFFLLNVKQGLFLVSFLLVFEWIQFMKKDQLFMSKSNIYIQSFFYVTLFFIYRFYSGVAEREFIYFQF